MDWITLIVGAVIGALVSIPFGIFVNFVTPWVKSYFENRSLTTQQRKIKILVTQYKHIKRLKEDPAYLNLHIFGILTNGIISIILLLGLGSFGWGGLSLQLEPAFSWISYVIIFVWIAFLISVLIGSQLYAKEISQTYYTIKFDEYKEQVIKKLIKLGGNPEDLDKE